MCVTVSHYTYQGYWRHRPHSMFWCRVSTSVTLGEAWRGLCRYSNVTLFCHAAVTAHYSTPPLTLIGRIWRMLRLEKGLAIDSNNSSMQPSLRSVQRETLCSSCLVMTKQELPATQLLIIRIHNSRLIDAIESSAAPAIVMLLSYRHNIC